MSEIRTLTLDELCEQGIVELQTGPFGSQLHAHDYVTSGVPVVPTEAIRDRRIDHDKLPHISEQKAAELKRHRLFKGDILFARRGVQATGQSALVRDTEVDFLCGTGAIRLRLKPNNKVLRPNFLSHVLMDRTSIDWIRHNAIGATMPNLNEGIIRRFRFLIPSLAEQEAISSILDAFEDKIDLNRRMNETLEAMARVIFKDWFVDFGPTRAKMEGRAPYLAPDIWTLFPDRLGAEGKPVGWMSSTIGEEVSVVGGSTPSTKVQSYWDDGQNCWATPKDLSALSHPVLLDTERKITDKAVAVISSGLLPAGTVLLSSRAPIGYLAIAEVCTAINQGFIAMRCTGVISNLFALLWCRENMDAITANANGSTFQEISKANFRPISLVRPLDETLKAFEATCRPLHDRLVGNVKEMATLATLRDLLLPKLMSGEIRVKDAEKLVGEAA